MGAVSHDPTLARYIDRVRAIPRLSREAERELALRAQEGDTAAAQALVEANLRFVVAVALQYRRYGISIWELLAEGSLGLMLGVRKFDPERGTRFVTYAGYWIRAYVLDLVVRSTTMVGAGSGALRSKLFFRLRRERAQLANRIQERDEVTAQLAERFSVTPQKMERMLQQLDARDVSLDATVHPESRTTMVETLEGTATDQETAFFADERRQHVTASLNEALDLLDQRERYIVEQRMMNEDELSLAELGRRLGVSRERARQLEVRAKRKLREQLSTLQPDAA